MSSFNCSSTTPSPFSTAEERLWPIALSVEESSGQVVEIHALFKAHGFKRTLAHPESNATSSTIMTEDGVILSPMVGDKQGPQLFYPQNGKYYDISRQLDIKIHSLIHCTVTITTFFYRIEELLEVSRLDPLSKVDLQMGEGLQKGREGLHSFLLPGLSAKFSERERFLKQVKVAYIKLLVSTAKFVVEACGRLKANEGELQTLYTLAHPLFLEGCSELGIGKFPAESRVKVLIEEFKAQVNILSSVCSTNQEREKILVESGEKAQKIVEYLSESDNLEAEIGNLDVAIELYDFKDLELYISMNRTDDLPKSLNDLDSWLEAKLRDKFVEKVRKLSKGDDDPIVANRELFEEMGLYLSHYAEVISGCIVLYEKVIGLNQQLQELEKELVLEKAKGSLTAEFLDEKIWLIARLCSEIVRSFKTDPYYESLKKSSLKERLISLYERAKYIRHCFCKTISCSDEGFSAHLSGLTVENRERISRALFTAPAALRRDDLSHYLSEIERNFPPLSGSGASLTVVEMAEKVNALYKSSHSGEKELIDIPYYFSRLAVDGAVNYASRWKIERLSFSLLNSYIDRLKNEDPITLTPLESSFLEVLDFEKYAINPYLGKATDGYFIPFFATDLTLRQLHAKLCGSRLPLSNVSQDDDEAAVKRAGTIFSKMVKSIELHRQRIDKINQIHRFVDRQQCSSMPSAQRGSTSANDPFFSDLEANHINRAKSVIDFLEQNKGIDDSSSKEELERGYTALIALNEAYPGVVQLANADVIVNTSSFLEALGSSFKSRVSSLEEKEEDLKLFIDRHELSEVARSFPAKEIQQKIKTFIKEKSVRTVKGGDATLEKVLEESEKDRGKLVDYLEAIRGCYPDHVKIVGYIDTIINRNTFVQRLLRCYVDLLNGSSFREDGEEASHHLTKLLRESTAYHLLEGNIFRNFYLQFASFPLVEMATSTGRGKNASTHGNLSKTLLRIVDFITAGGNEPFANKHFNNALLSHVEAMKPSKINLKVVVSGSSSSGKSMPLAPLNRDASLVEEWGCIAQEVIPFYCNILGEFLQEELSLLLMRQRAYEVNLPSLFGELARGANDAHHPFFQLPEEVQRTLYVASIFRRRSHLVIIDDEKNEGKQDLKLMKKRAHSIKEFALSGSVSSGTPAILFKKLVNGYSLKLPPALSGLYIRKLKCLVFMEGVE